MTSVSQKGNEIKRRLMDELREEVKEKLKREAGKKETKQEGSPEDNYPWLVFGLNGTEYGVNSKHVLSIEILKEITPIVDAAPSCPGITRSRGDLIELLDLRALFGLGDYKSDKTEEQNDRHMMVVTEAGSVKRGMLVDKIVSVEYIKQFDSAVIEKLNGTASSKYVSHVARREKLDTPVLIIRPESLCSA